MGKNMSSRKIKGQNNKRIAEALTKLNKVYCNAAEERVADVHQMLVMIGAASATADVAAELGFPRLALALEKNVAATRGMVTEVRKQLLVPTPDIAPGKILGLDGRALEPAKPLGPSTIKTWAEGRVILFFVGVEDGVDYVVKVDGEEKFRSKSLYLAEDSGEEHAKILHGMEFVSEA